MAELPQDKLDALERRFDSIEHAMSANPDPDKYVEFSKEYAELSPMVAKVRAYRTALSDLAGAEELVKSGDKEMAELAYEEMGELKEKIEALVQEIGRAHV